MASSPMRNAVPCNGCTLCCRGFFTVQLMRGDAVSTYKTERCPASARLVLARKPNGECAYLGAGGCTIYDRQPLACRAFDCRDLALRPVLNSLRQAQARGRELLKVPVAAPSQGGDT